MEKLRCFLCDKGLDDEGKSKHELLNFKGRRCNLEEAQSVVSQIELENNSKMMNPTDHEADTMNAIRIKDSIAVDGQHFVICNVKTGCEWAKRIKCHRKKVERNISEAASEASKKRLKAYHEEVWW